VLFNRGFDWATHKYSGFVRWLAHRWWIIATAFVLGAAGVFHLLERTPTAFIPNEDQGYYFVGVQMPAGCSLQRTQDLSSKVLEIVRQDPAVVDVITNNGFNLMTNVTQTNAAFIIVVLKPWDQRDPFTENAKAIIQRAAPKLLSLPEGIAMPFPPPPIPGLGTVAGWQLQLEDVNGQGFNFLAGAANDLMEALQKRPEVAGLNTPFQSQVPMVRIKIDRAKALNYGLNMSDIFAALGQTLGQSFINNFNEFNQVYNVMVQADAVSRMRLSDAFKLYVRNRQGGMVPLESFAEYEFIVGTDNATRYNLYNTIQLNGATGAGHGSGDAIQAVEEEAARVLPDGVSYEWTGTTYQQIEAGSYAPFVFIMAIVAVFLLLAALYESWILPLNVLLAVTFAVLGALVFMHIRERALDVYAQIGMVMLVGLAAKNAILIVEFAKMRYDQGESVIDAAVNASHQRLRPIMMTAIAFILGIAPLVVAVGAGANSRQSIGTTVMGGMIGSATFDQLVVPVFFVMIVGFAARYGLVKRMPHGEPPIKEGSDGAGETPPPAKH
jgi:hydrophobe/amphiphile efflux-1 (HAE1) family protein